MHNTKIISNSKANSLLHSIIRGSLPVKNRALTYKKKERRHTLDTFEEDVGVNTTSCESKLHHITINAGISGFGGLFQTI